MPRAPRTIQTTQSDFNRACKLIDARCGEFDFGVATIAADLACSSRQVQRIFATHQTTVRGELFLARMSRAARALAKQESISRSADLSGYPHPRHFATAFRRHYGLRPSDVRHAAKFAARLQKRSMTKPPAATSPQLSRYVKAWRADHQKLLRSLRLRRRGTILDELFKSAIALRGPDLRTPDGKATIAALRSPSPPGRASPRFLSDAVPATPGGAQKTSRARPRTPAGRT